MVSHYYQRNRRRHIPTNWILTVTSISRLPRLGAMEVVGGYVNIDMSKAIEDMYCALKRLPYLAVDSFPQSLGCSFAVSLGCIDCCGQGSEDSFLWADKLQVGSREGLCALAGELWRRFLVRAKSIAATTM